ncbi:MAG: exodeoxyribonuclease VII large subunit [Lachnospiraceae bacterium]|nr:exodeoxyribonuclease VII large subunit [Lachnospiraceae bacterium]
MNQPVFSVSQVNAYIKQMFSRDDRLRLLAVKGEVSNCKYHSSGHLYFTVKDKMGQLSCVMFASACRSLSFTVKEGMSVIVYGSVQVYERDGKYQLYAEMIEQDGMGKLFEQVELLKRQLAAEGLFDAERKKPIPRYAFTVGIITAATGAAIRDIVQIAGRRNPYVQLLLQPAMVQGEAAPESLVRALRALDAKKPDVIIIGRGGGSAEDLMAFHDEAVVRAVAACETPIISAVGHESDVALTDFAADLRAPTPSAAAELAVFEYRVFAEAMAEYHTDITYAMCRKINEARAKAEAMGEKLLRVGPAGAIKQKKIQIMYAGDRMEQAMKRHLTKQKHRLELLAGRLHAVSPAARLSGGYAFVTTKENKPLKTITDVAVQDTVRISLRDGSFTARVEEREEEHRKEADI